MKTKKPGDTAVSNKPLPDVDINTNEDDVDITTVTASKKYSSANISSTTLILNTHIDEETEKEFIEIEETLPPPSKRKKFFEQVIPEPESSPAEIYITHSKSATSSTNSNQTSTIGTPNNPANLNQPSEETTEPPKFEAISAPETSTANSPTTDSEVTNHVLSGQENTSVVTSTSSTNTENLFDGWDIEIDTDDMLNEYTYAATRASQYMPPSSTYSDNSAANHTEEEFNAAYSYNGHVDTGMEGVEFCSYPQQIFTQPESSISTPLILLAQVPSESVPPSFPYASSIVSASTSDSDPNIVLPRVDSEQVYPTPHLWLIEKGTLQQPTLTIPSRFFAYASAIPPSDTFTPPPTNKVIHPNAKINAPTQLLEFVSVLNNLNLGFKIEHKSKSGEGKETFELLKEIAVSLLHDTHDLSIEKQMQLLEQLIRISGIKGRPHSLDFKSGKKIIIGRKNFDFKNKGRDQNLSLFSFPKNDQNSSVLKLNSTVNLFQEDKNNLSQFFNSLAPQDFINYLTGILDALIQLTPVSENEICVLPQYITQEAIPQGSKIIFPFKPNEESKLFLIFNNINNQVEIKCYGNFEPETLKAIAEILLSSSQSIPLWNRYKLLDHLINMSGIPIPVEESNDFKSGSKLIRNRKLKEYKNHNEDLKFRLFLFKTKNGEKNTLYSESTRAFFEKSFSDNTAKGNIKEKFNFCVAGREKSTPKMIIHYLAGIRYALKKAWPRSKTIYDIFMGKEIDVKTLEDIAEKPATKQIQSLSKFFLPAPVSNNSLQNPNEESVTNNYSFTHQ